MKKLTWFVRLSVMCIIMIVLAACGGTNATDDVVDESSAQIVVYLSPT